jgi:hypothetical protein
MSRRRICRCVAQFASRVAVGLSAFGLIAMSLGVSAASVGQKDRSTPFPCMFSRCACKTAADCWRSCCCHSLSERLAWARKRRIEPPAEALAEAATIEPGHKRTCCKKGDSPDGVERCCAKPSDSPARSGVCFEEQRSGEPLKADCKAGVIALDEAPSCTGPGATWTGLPPVTTVALTSLVVELDPCGSADILCERFYFTAPRPLERPPRASV